MLSTSGRHFSGIKNEQYTTNASNWVQTQGLKITVGEHTVALKIIARCSITQTPKGQWNIDNVAD